MSTAAEGLDKIRQGGVNLLAAARSRIREAEDALDDGQFQSGLERLTEAIASLSPLASAEAHMAAVSSAVSLRASELEPGMTLCGVGEITGIEMANCTHDDCAGHVMVTIGDGQPTHFEGDMVLYVEAESA